MDNVTARAATWLAIRGNQKRELAQLLGISRPTLDRRFSGQSQWRWEEALKIADLTGCTPNDLAGI